MPRVSVKSEAPNKGVIDKLTGNTSLPGHFPMSAINTHSRGGGFQSLGVADVLTSVALVQTGSIPDATLGEVSQPDILLVERVNLSGVPYLLVSCARTKGSLYIGSITDEDSTKFTSATNLIIDVALVKSEDFYSNNASAKITIVGSFFSGNIDKVKVTGDNYKEKGFSLTGGFISTGYSVAYVVHANDDEKSGVTIQIVDEELTDFSHSEGGNTKTKLIRQIATGSNFSDIAEEYDGDFVISSNEVIPVILATRNGIFFSESRADLFVRYSIPNVGQIPVGAFNLDDEGNPEQLSEDEQIIFNPTSEQVITITELLSAIGTKFSGVITDTQRTLFALTDTGEQTDQFLNKRFRLVFNRAHTGVGRKVFTSWVEANKLNTTKRFDFKEELELFEQDLETTITTPGESIVTIAEDDFFSRNAGLEVDGDEYFIRDSIHSGSIFVYEAGTEGPIRTVQSPPTSFYGEHSAFKGGGLTEDFLLSGENVFVFRNGLYAERSARTLLLGPHVYSYPKSADKDGSVVYTNQFTLATPPASDSRPVIDSRSYTGAEPQNFTNFTTDGKNFYFLLPYSTSESLDTVFVYDKAGAFLRSFSTVRNDENNRVIGGRAIDIGTIQEGGTARLAITLRDRDTHTVRLFSFEGEYLREAVGEIPINPKELTRGTRHIVGTAFDEDRLLVANQADRTVEIFEYQLEQTFSTETKLDETMMVEGSYYNNAKMFDFEKVFTSELIEDPGLTSGAVEVIGSKDKNLFLRNTLDLDPILFDRREVEPPAIAVLDQDIFYVENNTLKYYSQRSDESRGVDVYAGGINLVNRNAMAVVQDGVILVRNSGLEGIVISRVHRSIFGSGYQTSHLAQYADLDQYDFSNIKIHSSTFGVVILCQRKSDSKHVALIIDTAPNSQNQYKDGYSIITLSGEPSVTWEDEGKVYYISADDSGQNLHELFSEEGETEWVGYYDNLGAAGNTKDFLAFLVEGEIAEGASIDVSMSLDNGSHNHLGTITFEDGTPVGEISQDLVGETEVGDEEIGGSDSPTKKRRKFEKIFQTKEGLASEFISASIRFKGTGGFHAISGWEWIDVSVHSRGRVY